MQTPFPSGNILQQNGDRAGRHYPPAIFVAGAQRDARVLHCKNPVHSPGAPRRLNGYPGCKYTISKAVDVVIYSCPNFIKSMIMEEGPGLSCFVILPIRFGSEPRVSGLPNSCKEALTYMANGSRSEKPFVYAMGHICNMKLFSRSWLCHYRTAVDNSV